MKRWITLTVALLIGLTCAPTSYAKWTMVPIPYLVATEFYSCMYNKPGEQEGLFYWGEEITAQGTDPVNLAIVATAFINCVELDEGVMTNADFVTRLYVMGLSRDPDTEGFNYWVERLTQITKGELMMEFIRSIHRSPGDDHQLFSFKTQLGAEYGYYAGINTGAPTNYYTDMGLTKDWYTFFYIRDIIRNL